MKTWLGLAAVVLSGTAVVRTQTASPKPAGFHLMEATIDDIHAALAAKTITCRQLTQLYLRRIDAYDDAGPGLNAVQTVNAGALREAERLDAAFASGGAVGPLHCIPVLVKDQIETSDMPTTYGSAVFAEFVPQRDATVVTRLKQAGAVILGKTTMGELAQGYVSSAAGVIRNAYDPRRTATGSSGGTGVAVTSNLAAVGIGEDTLGSIRNPASAGSLVGLRPTVPLVSRFGMMPALPSSDTLGPMTRTVRDAAIVLDAIAGYDRNDPVTVYAAGQVPASYTASLDRDGLRGARIGVIRDPMDAKTEPDSEDYGKVRSVITRSYAALQAGGAELIDPVVIPRLHERLGIIAGDVFEFEPAVNRYLAEHPNASVRTLRDILMSGKVAPSRARALMNVVGRSTEEAGYLRILSAKEELRQAVLAVMAEQRLDAFVYASDDHQPDPIPADPLRAVYAPRGNNRVLTSVIGFPAMTVPAGFTSDGLPAGIEFMGKPFSEPVLFKLAYAYEQATRYRKPPAAAPPLPNEP